MTMQANNQLYSPNTPTIARHRSDAADATLLVAVVDADADDTSAAQHPTTTRHHNVTPMTSTQQSTPAAIHPTIAGFP
jgi:hypothetical protein